MSFQPLTSETLPSRLGKIAQMHDQLGAPNTWHVREIGDGNMNYVYHVEGEKGSVIVKQALPYIRSVGESWPLTIKRIYFEYHALKRHNKAMPDRVPEVYYFDEEQAILVMEHLSPHIILRKSLMGQNIHNGLGKTMGEFCANSMFKNSDLYLEPAQAKMDTALFAGNYELCDATADVVFTSLYTNRDLNRHTSPYLDEITQELRNDDHLKEEAQHLKWKFWTNCEALLHGDLHTGSIMVHEEDVKVIDPEFALYGPMGFDVGMLMANFIMAYYSQPGHVQGEACQTYQDWLLRVVEEFWLTFAQTFKELWHNERKGVAYCKSILNEQSSERAASKKLAQIFEDALGFCGLELHRRIIGISHNAEFEEIEDEAQRAQCELKALKLGRLCILNRRKLTTIDEIMKQIIAQ